MTTPRLATIGYQLATQAQVIERLKDAGVEVLIDVRAIASSRRAGFSKTLLAASLNEAGIAYVHLRQLGTPKPGRDAAHHGRIAEMHAIYHQHLADPGAQKELAEATAIARDAPAALLCFEADAAGCHRRIIADLIRADLGCEVLDL
jgi:uncharacterized protein (DUF488 family)